MATVESIVAQIGADVAQYSAGLRRATAATEQFLADIQRSTQGMKFIDESEAERQAHRAARLVVVSFQQDFERSQSDLRESLFRGALSEDQFRKQGAAAAKAYNDAVLERIRLLGQQGELTEPLHRQLVASLKDAGLEASAAATRAANAHPLLGNLTTQGQRAAQSLLNGLSREFNDRMLTLREQFGRGIISRDTFTAQGKLAGAAFNAGIGTGIDTLRDKGQLTENIRRALVESMKDAGDQAGNAAAQGILAKLAASRADLTRLASGLSQVGRTLTFAVTAPVLGLAGLAVKEATDAEAAGARMGAVFGANANAITAQLETLRRFVPATTAALQDAATEANGIWRSFGIAAAASQTLSVATVRVAGNFAALKRVDLSTALSAIESSLRGNGRALATYGVDIRQTTVKQEGLRLGLIKNGETLNDAGKAVAAFNIILREMGPASDYAQAHVLTAAEQFGLLRADFSETAAAIGRDMLPALVAVAHALLGFVESIQKADPGIRRILETMALLAATVGPLLVALGAFLRIMAAIGVAAELAAGAEGVAGLVGSLGLLGATLGVGAIVIAGLTALWFWLNRNRDAAGSLGGQLDSYKASLGSLTEAQLRANAAQIESTQAYLRVEQQRLQIQVAGDKLREGQTAKPTQEEQSRLDRLQLINRYLAENDARLSANRSALADHDKAAAASAEELRKLKDAFANLGTSTAEPSTKTPLEQMAASAKSLYENARQLRDRFGDVAGSTRTILDLWDRVAAKVTELGPSTAKGAEQLRELFDTLAKDKAVKFFRGDETGHVKLDTTDALRLMTTVGERAQEVLNRVRLPDDFMSARFLPSVQNDLSRKLAASIQAGLTASFLGLRVAPTVQVQLDTSGVSGHISKLALGVGQAGDSLRKLVATSDPLRQQFAVIGNAMLRVAGAMDAASRVLGTIASDVSSPLALVRTGVTLFGSALALTTRGILAAAEGIGRTVLSALNPLNVFAQFAQKIGEALSPALNALAGPLGRLAATVADALTPVFEALAPVVDALIPVIRELFNAIGPILVALAPLLKVFAQLLDAAMPIIRALAIAFTYLGQVVLVIAAALTRFFGNLIIGFGKVIEVIATAVDKLPFVSAKGAINFAKDIQAMGKGMLGVADTMSQSASALGKARDQIKSGNYMNLADGSAAAADGLQNVADTAANVSDQLRNVPEGFKVALQRWRAALPMIALNGGFVDPTQIGPNAPAPGAPSLGGASFSMAPIVVQGPIIVTADSETTATKVMNDIVGEAQVRAAQATGKSGDYARFLPSVLRAAVRSSPGTR